MKLLKIITLAMTMILTTTLLSACGGDKNDDAQVKNTSESAMSQTAASVTNETANTENTEAIQSTENNQENVKVFAIETVFAPEQGKAVNFTWTENGKNMNFAELTKGKVALINFWGTWCPPCRMEIPDLVKLHNDLEKENLDVVMIGIALERNLQTAMQKVTSFAQAQNMTYYQFVDQNRDIVKNYGGINAVPTTFIVDKDGKIVETIVGMRNYDAFMNSIKKALNK